MFSAFGTPAPSPFGSSSSTSPFGQAKPFGTPAFGSQTGGGLFGSGTATGVFGSQPSQPAPFGSGAPPFGSPAASPFGTSQPGFTNGTSVFGTPQPAFGTATSAFGTSQPSQPAFGTATFGQNPAFGSFGSSTPSPAPTPALSNPFGSPSSLGSFGTPQQQQQQAPAFGAGTSFGPSTTAPAFGSGVSTFSTQPAFNTNSFGSFGSATPSFGQQQQSPPPFGSTSTISTTPGFGFNQSTTSFGATKVGSRVVPYNPKSEPDNNTMVKLRSISTMDAYNTKSHEELRWEDYQRGDKGGPAPSGTGLFGPTTSSTPFPSTTTATGFFQQPQSSFQTPSPSIFPNSTNTPAPTFPSSFPSAPSLGFTSSPSLFPSITSTPAAPSFAPSPAPAPQQTLQLFPTTPQPQQQPQPSLFPSMFGESKPAGTLQTPLFQPTTPAPSPSPFSFNPTQTQPGSGLFGSAPLSTPAPSLFGSQPVTNPVQTPMPAPVYSPFGTLPAVPQISVGRAAGSTPSVQYGISSTPVSEKPVKLRIANTLSTPRPGSRIRMHQARKPSSKKEPPRVSFFSDGEEDAPVTPKADVAFIPRENPRALFIHPVSKSPPKRSSEAVITEHTEEIFHESNEEDSAPREAPDTAPRSGEKSSSNGLEKGNRYITLTGHRAGEAAIAYEHGADIEALMPKLRSSDYYTEPRVQELAAKERSEPGYCRRVPDFIVGRKGFGLIKFLEETDVRRLDIEGIIQLNKCEVLVYMDESKKPPVGQGLNKPAIVTLYNVKCTEKSTGRSLFEGPQVERFESKLRKKTEAQEAEFVSFDPVKGEWVFRVTHFSRYGLDEGLEG